jgi:uncharacterized protein YqeY
MGSYCNLKFGEKDISCFKNSIQPEWMSIFTDDDREYKSVKCNTLYPDDYDPNDEEICKSCSYKTTVKTAKKRLDILGFGLQEGSEELARGISNELEYYNEYLDEHDSEDTLYNLYMSHKSSLDRASVYEFINVHKVLFGFCDESMADKNLLNFLKDNSDEYAHGILTKDIRFALRMLLECFEDDDYISLDVTDLIDGGWLDYEDDLVEQSRNNLTENFHYDSKIIILTEGSSDVSILESSFSILYPEFKPLYTFMDFGASKASGGASSLVSVIKSFIGAGIKNRIVAIFDNDTAARVAMKSLRKVALPQNIAVMTYPHNPFLESYPTLGPSGNHQLDVNGLAGSIELYLCKEVLLFNGELSPVQWKGYEQSLSCYQGEVLNKAEIQKKFYQMISEITENKKVKSEFNWEGLELIFEHIFKSFQKTLIGLSTTVVEEQVD